MKKCLLTVCLIIAMLASVLPIVSAETNSTNNSEYDSQAVNFSLQLGLLSPNSDGELVLTQSLTRAELASALRKLINTPSLPEAKLSITDMETDDPLYGDVAAAIYAGLFNPPESGMFRPNDPVFAYQIVSSILDILGYRPVIADNMDWASAAKLGLLDGLSIGEMDVLSYGQAAKIFYNSMSVPMMIQPKYGDNKEYIVSDSARIYTEYWKASYASGVVNGNAKTELSTDNVTEKNHVLIDDKLYKIGSTNADTLLGYKTEYWYTEDNTLLYIQKLEENSEMKINAADIADTERNRLSFYNEKGNKKTVNFADGVDVIYNDRALFNYTAGDLKPQNGFAELIDNNGDGLYEVIKIYEYTNYYILSLDNKNQTITDGLHMSTIDLSDDDKLCVDIKRWQKQSNELYLQDFNQMTAKSIVSVMKSRDGQCVTVIYSGEKVSGTVSAVKEKDDKLLVTVNETEYTVSSDYRTQMTAGNKKAVNIEAGMAATVYLDFNNEIAFVSTDLTEWQYGFMSNAMLEGGFSKQLKLRVFNDEGEWVDLSSEKTLTYNKIDYKDAANVYTLLKQSGGVKPQAIKYKLRPDGSIAELETASDSFSNAASRGYDTENFTRDASMSNVKYKIRNRSFGHKYAIELTTTTMFYIPSGAYDAQGNINEDEVMFVGGNYFVNDKSYSLDVYDSDEYYIPRLMIITASSTENYETDILYVNDKILIMDNDGDETYLLEGIQGDTEVSYVCREKKTAEAVKPGDALKISLMNNGRIMKLVRLACFSDTKASGTEIKLAQNCESNSTTDFGLYAATVYDVDYVRSAVLTYIDNPLELNRFSGSYMKILTYNAEKERFETGDISLIYGAAQSSEPSRVFLHDRYLETRSLVIINGK